MKMAMARDGRDVEIVIDGAGKLMTVDSCMQVKNIVKICARAHF